MKTIGSLASHSLVCVIFLFAGCGRDAREPSPAALTLTAGNTQVVIAPDAGPVVRFAAEELTNFLAQALGGPVPIVNELESRVGVGERTVNIVLGTNKWSVAAGLHPEKLPRDSFVISTSTPQNPNTSKPDTIFIAGCDDPKWDIRRAWRNGDSGECGMPFERATLFGVYDFLERYAGCRFYFDGPLGTIVPKKSSLTVPVGTCTESPSFSKRMMTAATEALKGDGSAYRGCQHSFIQNLRNRRYSGSPLIHGIRHLNLPERFGKTHPEYFAALRTKDGKVVHQPPKYGAYTHLCWSSGVFDEIYQDWVAYAKGLPPESRGIKCDPTGGPGVWPRLAFAPGMVAFDADDGFVACECDKCRAAYGTDKRDIASGFASKVIWSKTGELARRLKKDGIALKVFQDAYSVALKRPEGMTLPDNVVISVSHWGPWYECKPERQAKELNEIRAWRKLTNGAKVDLHNYACKYGNTKIAGLPCWTPKSVGSYYARVGSEAEGVYMESLSENYAHIYLNNYILGKMAWDTSFDYQAAIDEHHRLMFGAGAPEMTKFFDDLEDLWLNRIMAGKTTYNELGPVQITPSPFEIWRTIYTAEKLAEWERLFEAAEEKVKVRGEGGGKVKGKGERPTKEGSNSIVSPLPSNLDLQPVSNSTVNLQPSTSTCSTTSNLQPNLYLRRIALMRRNILEDVERVRREFAENNDPEREEARRKREGVRNLLDKEYAFVFDVPELNSKDLAIAAQGAVHSIRYKFETNTTYRLSFFLDAESVTPSSAWRLNGALVAVWCNKPAKYFLSNSSGAITGSTYGRVHQSLVLRTGPVFEDAVIEVWLRGATGKMKVDGLILEKVE